MTVAVPRVPVDGAKPHLGARSLRRTAGVAIAAREQLIGILHPLNGRTFEKCEAVRADSVRERWKYRPGHV